MTQRAEPHVNPKLEAATLRQIMYAARDMGQASLPILERELGIVPAGIMAREGNANVMTAIRARVDAGKLPTPFEIKQMCPALPDTFWVDLDRAEEAADLSGNLAQLMKLRAARLARAAAALAIRDLDMGAEPEEVIARMAAQADGGNIGGIEGIAGKDLGDTLAYLDALTGGDIPMYTTGFPELNDRLGGGLEGGSYVLIGMATNTGKTRLALQMAYAQLVNGLGVVYASGEMKRTLGGDRSVHRIAMALHLMRAGLPPRLINRRAQVSAESRKKISDAVQWLSEVNFSVYDRDMSIDNLASLARRMKREGQHMMIIDNFNHVTLPGQERMAGWEQKNIISERLAEIAHSTGIVIVCLVQTQINSQLERPAHLDEISDSKGVARPADLIITAWRPINEAGEKAAKGEYTTYGMFSIVKRRQGVGGDVKVGWREDLSLWMPVMSGGLA